MCQLALGRSNTGRSVGSFSLGSVDLPSGPPGPGNVDLGLADSAHSGLQQLRVGFDGEERLAGAGRG